MSTREMGIEDGEATGKWENEQKVDGRRGINREMGNEQIRNGRRGHNREMGNEHKGDGRRGGKREMGVEDGEATGKWGMSK